MKSVINCQELYSELHVNSFEPIHKRDGLDLFKHPMVEKWHQFFLSNYKSNRPLALLLPCTSIKPYNRSATHRLAYSIIKKAGVEDFIQVYSVSEPMLLVPREFEDCYPFNSYEYSPKVMSKEEKEEFIDLLRQPLHKIIETHNVIVGVLPKHHYSIVSRSLSSEVANFSLFKYDKLAFKSIHTAIFSLISEGKNKGIIRTDH